MVESDGMHRVTSGVGKLFAIGEKVGYNGRLSPIIEARDDQRLSHDNKLCK
jgi:hypothetical protein